MSDTEYLLVTEFFDPDTASTGRYMTDIAAGLRERGLDITVLTAQPHYHSGDHERQPHETTHEGVRVKRVRTPHVQGTSPLHYAFNWLTFAIGVFATLLLSQPTKEREVLFVSNPPILPQVMWGICRLRNWSYTYILFDIFPRSFIHEDIFEKNGPIARIWRWSNRYVFRDAEKVITVGTKQRDIVIEQAKPAFDSEKVARIDLWEDETFLEPKAKADNPFSIEHGLVEKFTVLYSGNIGEMHDLETLVRASTALDGEDITILIIGEGSKKERVVSLAEQLDVAGKTVKFLPFQPMENLPHSLTSADVSVVSKKAAIASVSCKVYSALAAGQPVLAIADSDSDEARIVTEHDAGIHIAPNDVDGTVEAIEQWRSNPKFRSQQAENARKAFERNYTREECLDAYYRVITRPH